MGKFRKPIGKLGKRTLGIVLSVALLVSAIAIAGSIPTGALLNVGPAIAPPNVYFGAPETIYVNPINNQTQFFANNFTSTSSGATWGSLQTGEQSTGYIHFYSAGATGITISLDEAPSGYSPTFGNGLVETGGLNRTLSAGASAPNSGLVRWRADFTAPNGLRYTSYCYSYLYVPDMRAISGAATHSYDHIAGGDVKNRGDVGMFIIGAHYSKAPTGGSYAASTLLQSRLWGGYPSGNSDRWVSTSGGTASNNLLTTGNGITYASRDDGTGDSTYQNHIGDKNTNLSASNDSNGGTSYITIDSSRYSNLTQIPQLRAVYVVARAVSSTTDANENVEVLLGKDSNTPSGEDIAGAAGHNDTPSGTFVDNPATSSYDVSTPSAVTEPTDLPQTINGSKELYRAPIKGYGVAPGSTGTARVRGGYHWHYTEGGLWTTHGHNIHSNAARVTWTAIDKTNLRKQMQEEINLGTQFEGMRGEGAYESAMKTLATALCNPAYDFGATVADDLGPATLSRSMAGQVRLARNNLEGKTGQAEAQYRNAITGGIIPMAVSGNSITYEMGEQVTAQYDTALDIPVGYEYPPVAVSVPYLANANDEAATTGLTPPGATPGAANAATGFFPAASFGAGGLAPNSTSAPNTNVKVPRLQWVWWLKPITYTLRLLPGTGTGTPVDITLYYGQEFILPDATSQGFSGGVDPNFVDWKFDSGTLMGGRYAPGAKVKNLTNAQGAIVTATAQWTGGTGSTFIFNFNTSDPSFNGNAGSSATWGGSGTVGSGNLVEYTVVPNGTTLGQLNPWPAGTRPGFSFDGWFTDAGLTIPFVYNVTTLVESTNRVAYAKWTPYTYNINYNGNSATIGTPPPAHTGVAFDDTSQVVAGDNGLEKPGYTFAGWSKAPALTAGRAPLDGKTQGTDYWLEGDTIEYSDLFTTPAPTSNGSSATLYAVWKADVIKVNFRPNWDPLVASDGAGPTSDPIVSQDKYYNGTYDENEAGTAGVFPADPVRFGFTFVEWNTKADGTGTRITAASRLNQQEDHDVFAIWLSGTPVTVTIDPNGGTMPSGVPDTLTRALGSQITLEALKTYQPLKPGYTFDYWTIETAGSAAFVPGYSASYSAGTHTGIELNGATTLKANWKATEYKVRYWYDYEAIPASSDSPIAIPGPATDYLEGGLLKLGGTETETPEALAREGYTLLGFAYASKGAQAFDKTTTPALLTLASGTGNGDAVNDDSGNPVYLNVYAVWEAKGGGTVDPDDPGTIPTDPPEPPFGPDDLDPNDNDPDSADDGYIVLYYTAPADVTVTPATPNRKYLTYGQAYGALPIADKADIPATQSAAGIDYIFAGWKVVLCGNGQTTPLLDQFITGDMIVRHEYSIWVVPVFTEVEIPKLAPDPTCWQRIQACLTTTRNKIIKFFFPLLSLGLPLLNYGIPRLTVEMVFNLPFHTLFLACLFGLIVLPVFLIIPSWFTVIHELAPSWWPNVKRFYLL